MTAYDATQLTNFAISVAAAMGADDDIATEVGTHLVKANLAGHASHGIIRLGQYFEHSTTGQLTPNARPSVLQEKKAALLLDANRGFGQWSTMVATEHAIERADEYGIGIVTLRHSMHIGRLGEYAEKIMAAGKVAMVTVGMAGPGVGGMAIPGTNARFMAANPWTFGIPARGGDLLVDASTAAIAEGKVRVARDAGTPLPEGALVGADGQPTTSAEDFYAGGSILPLGGTVGMHKGFGFALAAAAVGGLGMIGDDNPTMAGASSVAPGPNTGRLAGATVIAIDLDAFGGADGYADLVGDMTDAIRQTPSRNGSTPIVPGEPERTRTAELSAAGVELPAATVDRLNSIANELHIEGLKDAS